MGYGPDTALIVVDVQNDFASPEGSLYVRDGETVIPFINAQVEAATAGGSVVVFTQDWHPPSTPHFVTGGGPWPVHCVAGSPGSAFHPALTVAEDATVLRKGVGGEDGYSAFTLLDPATGAASATGLADRLKDAGITRVVVVGLALDYCVRATAVDAVQSGFETTVLADGTRAVDLRAGDGPRAVVAMVGVGVIVE